MINIHFNKKFIIIFIGLVLFLSINVILYKYLNNYNKPSSDYAGDLTLATPLTSSPTSTPTIQPTLQPTSTFQPSPQPTLQPTPFPTVERKALYGESIPDRSEISVWGNAKVRVVDGAGNITGLTDVGLILEDVPLSSCMVLDNSTFITLPAKTTVTLYITMGEGFGPQIEVSRLVYSTNDMFLPEQRAIFLDFPFTAGETAEMSINVLQDLSNLKLSIDRHSEGKPNLAIAPSSVIDYKQAEDLTNPVTSISVTGQKDASGFYSGPVTVTLSAKDDYTGVLKTNYSLDGGKNWQTYNSPLNLNAEQVPIIYVESIDKAGNREYPWPSKRLRP